LYNISKKALDAIDGLGDIDFSNAPTFVKQAAAVTRPITSGETETMNAEDFALVFRTPEGHDIPKYPVHDVSHAWRSKEAFDKTASLLPPSARIIAATFIKRACDNYGIECESYFEKISSNKLDSNIYEFGKETYWDVDLNDSTARLLLSDDLEKTAKRELVDRKRNSLDDDSFALTPKTASVDKNMYPIFSSDLAQQSMDYFDKYYRDLEPEDRRTYAIKTASKARVFGLKPSRLMKKYAGHGYSKDLEVHLQSRKDMLTDALQASMYDRLWEKKANISPDNFAEVLGELDEDNGLDEMWDEEINDPYYSTLSNGEEEYEDRIDSYRYDYGSGSINGLDLGKLAEGPDVLAGYFNPEVISAFTNDPIEIFESMPRPQKMLIVNAINGDLGKRTSGFDRAGEENQLDDIVTGKTAANKMIKDPPAAKNAQKPLLGGKALKPILPAGPTAMGVETPSSRMIDKTASLTPAKLREYLLSRKTI
jgi:hypothetical protein